MVRICRSATRSLSQSLFIAPPRRSYGGAAALQLEYDSDEEEYGGDRRLLRGAAVPETWDEMEGRGVQWVFMGAQKHVYATRVSKLLDVPYISMGSLVRQELNPRSSLYKQIANAVNKGKLVPEEIIFGLLSNRLKEGYDRGETGFILDGIPRTRVQAEILDQIADIDLVVNFKCMEDCLVKKHVGNGICLNCQKSFKESNLDSTSLNPFLATTTRHSELKSSTVADMEESRMENFRSYAGQSKLLEEYYRKRMKLLDFQVATSPGETWRRLLDALHLQHSDACQFFTKTS